MAEEEDTDKKKGADEAVLERARKRFQQAMDAEDENRGKEMDDMKFLASTPDDNFQWPQDILNARRQPGQEGGIRPCLTVNKMRPHQHQVLNEIRMNRPQITARPGDSRASAEVAKALNGWLRHIQVASEADLAIDIACNWQTGAGEGFFRLFTQFADELSFEQEVVFASCPDRFKVYLDPIGLMQHPAGRKCRWGFITEDLPKEEYEEFYGEENAIDWTLEGTGDHINWFPSKEVVRVAEYFELEDQKKTICEWKLPDGTTVVSVKDSPEDARYSQAGYEKTRERATKVPRCIWRKITGQKVLATKEMPTKYIPIVRVVGNEFVIDGKVMVDGMVRPAKDAQRMYNYNASVEIETNALQPKAPISVMVDQVKGHEDKYRTANQVSHAYLPFNAVRNDDGTIVNIAPPQRIQPATPPSAIIQAKIGADQDIKATMGQWGPALGEPSGEKSGKAINARKTESDVGSFHYMDNVARALKYAGAIALDMAAEVIDSKRIVRILGEDGEPDHIVVDPDLPVPYQETMGQDGKKVKIYNFALGKYEVVVNTGASFATRRAEAAEFLTSAVQSAKDAGTANVLTYLALKNQDWAGAEEAVTLLKAMLPPPAQQALAGESEGNIPPEAKAIVDQLKGMVGHTKGQLDAAKQALAARDQEMQSLKGQLEGKNREALVKMYEADKRALSEIEKAKAQVLIARAETEKAALTAAPEAHAGIAAMVGALDKMIGEMDQKITALDGSTKAIAAQLNNFEVAARMPQAA